MPLYVWAVFVTTAIQAAGALGHLALPVLAGEAAADFGRDPGWIGVYSGIVFTGSAASSLLLTGSAHDWRGVAVALVSDPGWRGIRAEGKPVHIRDVKVPLRRHAETAWLLPLYF